MSSFVKFEKSSKRVNSPIFDAILRKLGHEKCEFFFAHSNRDEIFCQNPEFHPIPTNGLDFTAIWKVDVSAKIAAFWCRSQ